MVEEKGKVRRRSQPKARATSLGAAASSGGAKTAQPKATGEVKLVETMTFEFAADRFGFDPSPRATEDEIKYAREALRALDHWADAMGELFGDVDRGLRAAGDARILPYNPTWSSTFESRQRVRNNLGTDIEAYIAPEMEVPHQGNALIDQKTRDAVEELRIYLRMLWTWRKTFEAGLWIATIAAQGSIEADPQRRLLRGLGAIAAVCEFDAIDTPDRILAELFGVAAHASYLTSEAPEKPAFTLDIEAVIRGANAALDRQYSDSLVAFVVRPSLLYDWTDGLRKDIVKHQHEGRLSAQQWGDLEFVYWHQWDWPMMGAVARRQLSVKMSVLDLMIAARYDGATFLHWRGGLLSIAQWSRILAVASPERFQIMREPAEAALGQLGFPELVGKPSQPLEKSSVWAMASRSSARAAPPLVALSILSKDSTLWLWRPDPAARAFALLPRERHETDERIAHYGTEAGPTGQSLLTGLIARSNEEPDAAQLHLIEAPPGLDIGDINGSIGQLARTLNWGRVYFAAQQPALGGARRSLRSSARSIRELVVEIRRKYPELFPDEFTSRWRRWFTGIYRRFERSESYAFMRRWSFFKWLERSLAPFTRIEH